MGILSLLKSVEFVSE